MKSQTFDIPYIFTVTGTPKRGSKERQGFFFETVRVSIPDLSGSEAPVAALFPEEFGATTYVGENCTVELRYHDEKLFNKALAEASGTHFDVSPDMLVRFLEGGVYNVENSFVLDKILPDRASTLQRGLFPGPDDHHNPIKPFDPSYWSSFTSKDREEKRSKTEALSSNLAIVDGRFWNRVPEPRYRSTYRPSDRGQPEYVSVAIVDPSDRLLRGATGYGLTNWERMARDTLDRYGIEVDETKRATILIEEAFPFDEAHVNFLRDIAEAISHDGDMLKNMELPSIMAWVAMRDAMATVRAGEFEQQHLDALAEVADAYSRCPRASEHAKKSISSAIRHFDDTAVSMSNLAGGQTLRP